MGSYRAIDLIALYSVTELPRQERIKAASPGLQLKLRNTDTQYTGILMHTQTYLHGHIILSEFAWTQICRHNPRHWETETGRSGIVYASLGQL